ncbi:hypothetical protein NDNC_0510 [Candidatus Nasuia deltocephalinicola]|nr:hypothetical protein QUR95_00485 [Candidatus Nasuia deltocephalinicola]BEH03885.1 hypothetical protein NDNC_0510 [Candidatus Nasuia deltocephalinicola]
MKKKRNIRKIFSISSKNFYSIKGKIKKSLKIKKFDKNIKKHCYFLEKK